jgi:uncharacterized repeat protein (TIGR03803 family)
MKRTHRQVTMAVCLMLIAVLFEPVVVNAQVVGNETTLYTFTGGTDGQGPTDLVPYTDGNFYGSATNTLFKVTPAGAFSTLFTLCVSCPTPPPDVAGLVIGSDGNFYGLTAAADSRGATFFKMTSAGVFTSLNSAVPGNPANSVYEGDGSKLVLGTDGNFYGADSGVGTSGSIFKIAPDGTFTTLYSFSATGGTNDTNSDGKTPYGRLTQGSDGNFYGTTRAGGTYGSGTVFQMTPAGALTSLYSFGAIGTGAGTPGQNLDGLFPVAGLIQGADGNFYGGTTSGGLHGIGTLFKVTAAGALTVLHQFNNATAGTLTLSISPTTVTLGQSATLTWASTSGQSEGGGPLHSLTLGQDGNLYGFGGEVASASDTVFQLTPAGLYTTLIPASAGNANGGDPDSLFQSSDGSFYGTTRYGNDSGPTPDGTVFKMVLSTGSPSSPCTASTSPTTNGGAWAGAEVAGGTATVTPTATGVFVYALSCAYPQPTGTLGPQFAQLTVTAAVTPAPTVTLTATPNSVTLGQSSTLTWTSTNATSCTASGAWNGGEPVSGSLGVTPSAAGAQTYTLTCTGAGGSAMASATLSAVAPVVPAPTVTLADNPTSITVGQSSTLTWTSTNATSCSASGGWSGTEAVAGTQVVTPTATGTTTFTLTCAGSGGSASASAPLVVNAAPASTVTLTASPTSISVGQNVVVTWSSTNATSCTASGAWTGTLATHGSITETPSVAGTSIYTLMCSGSGNAATTASATVTVQAAAGAPTQTNLSGRAGGGGLSWNSVLGLALLVALRVRGALRALLSALAALAFIVPAGAQDTSPQWQFNWDQSYLGLRIGSGDYRESSSHLDAEVAGSGFSGIDTSITHHRFGGAAYVGVPFYRALSLELGFADLGRYPVAISTSSSDIAPLSQTIARKLWPAGQAVTLGLAAPLDVASWFAIEPRLGLLAFRSKQEVFTPLGTFSDDRTGGGLDAGLSLLVHPARAVYIGVGFDCFDLGGHASVFLYSAEITYHFGT